MQSEEYICYVQTNRHCSLALLYTVYTTNVQMFEQMSRFVYVIMRCLMILT